MNNIKFNQTGGFPLSTNRLNDLQEAYQTLQVFGSCIGEKSIIKGCIKAGNLITEGYLFIDGELIFYKGGAISEGILIKEDIEKLEYENGEEKATIYIRYAVSAGASQDTILWSELTRPNTLLELSNKVAELEIWTAPFKGEGSLVFWNKPANTIPKGWKEAVDWRGRMPVGQDPRPNDFDFGEVGKTGGNKEIKISIEHLPENIPSNTITFSHEITDFGIKTGRDTWVHLAKIGGNGRNLNIMNPYKVVIFIERDI